MGDSNASARRSLSTDPLPSTEEVRKEIDQAIETILERLKGVNDTHLKRANGLSKAPRSFTIQNSPGKKAQHMTPSDGVWLSHTSLLFYIALEYEGALPYSAPSSLLLWVIPYLSRRHPFTRQVHGSPSYTGAAGQDSIAHLGTTCTFTGRNAHAGSQPWEGVNALDALVSAYNSISMLRQEMRPEERVHGCVLEAPKVANVIPDRTKVYYSVRSPTKNGVRQLGNRVVKCFEVAAMATGCEINIEEERIYADLRLNRSLCASYTSHMSSYGRAVNPINPIPMTGSTDQGNVTHEILGLHVVFDIPTPPDMTGPHTAGFQQAAGQREAFEEALTVGKALALVGWDCLVDEGYWERIKGDFKVESET